MKMIRIDSWEEMRHLLRQRAWPGDMLWTSGEAHAAYGVTIDETATYLYVRHDMDGAQIRRLYRLNNTTDRFQEITGSDTAKNLMESHFYVAKMEELL